MKYLDRSSTPETVPEPVKQQYLVHLHHQKERLRNPH